jgi:hypothetical protein
MSLQPLQLKSSLVHIKLPQLLQLPCHLSASSKALQLPSQLTTGSKVLQLLRLVASSTTANRKPRWFEGRLSSRNKALQLLRLSSSNKALQLLRLSSSNKALQLLHLEGSLADIIKLLKVLETKSSLATKSIKPFQVPRIRAANRNRD